MVCRRRPLRIKPSFLFNRLFIVPMSRKLGSYCFLYSGKRLLTLGNRLVFTGPTPMHTQRCLAHLTQGFELKLPYLA